MDAELKAKWVSALKSGEFKQCRETIADGKGLCCLGVLSHVIDAESVLDYPSFSAVDEETQMKLVNMNDGREGSKPHSFAEIADYIEKNL